MKYFNADMTYPEAQNVLFSAVKGKPMNEVKKIKDEYAQVLPTITRRELTTDEGWMTEHPLNEK